MEPTAAQRGLLIMVLREQLLEGAGEMIHSIGVDAGALTRGEYLARRVLLCLGCAECA